MAKEKTDQLPFANVDRERVCRYAALLAAATGEDALVIAEEFATWTAKSTGSVMTALEAAVIEASQRHEHLRGRKPPNLKAVLARAEEFRDFIGD